MSPVRAALGMGTTFFIRLPIEEIRGAGRGMSHTDPLRQRRARRGVPGIAAPPACRVRVAVAAAILTAATGFPTMVQAADPALNVGAIEVLAVPDVEHLGVYPYAAASLAFSVGRVVIIPGLGLEYSPEFGRWGFVGGSVIDVPMTSRIGVDFIVSAIHDQSGGQWGEALFFLGGGAGVSITLGPTVVSPSASAYRGLNTVGWSVVPGINVAYVFQGGSAK